MKQPIVLRSPEVMGADGLDGDQERSVAGHRAERSTDAGSHHELPRNLKD
jgi:hypothetical protein